jgi:N-acetylmuramoyl-L-alanine amidase
MAGSWHGGSTVTALESFFSAVGLLWERLHIITADTPQAPGVTCAWQVDQAPVGDRVVAAGELVELRVTLDHDHPLTAGSGVRFDVLEFDWLFTGGFDDPVVSLNADPGNPPDGGFTTLDRALVEANTGGAVRTVEDAINEYRVAHPADFEQSILVVREPDHPDIGRTHAVAWWRAVHEDEAEPTLYFLTELGGLRDSSTVALRVATLVPGANVRIHGRITDADPADANLAQPVSRAEVTVGARRTRTTDNGSFVIDARLPLGVWPLLLTRPGIDDRTLTVRVSQAAGGGVDVALLDADAADQQLQAGTVPADADPQRALLLRADLRVRVHRLRGVVRWPRSTGLALPLAGRRVYAVPLAAGGTAAQRPVSSRALELLARRDGVLRSARPDRPAQREVTGPDGAFELSFVDLRPGAQYVLWVQRADPRVANSEVAEAVVRTVNAAAMRAMNGDDASQQDQTDRIVVDSTYNLLTDSVANTVEVIRVVDRAVPPAPADVRVLRPSRAEPTGIDADRQLPATPPRGDEVPYDAATRRARDLVLEVLPLVPVFETADAQSAVARWATSTVREQLDAQHPRGHLLGGWRFLGDLRPPNQARERWALRWVLDARRADPLGTAWNSLGTIELLEETLATERSLTSAQVNDPGWVWWRIDALSLADFARVTIPANGNFADRRLQAELVPVLEPPVPRLTGLFARRHVHVSPGHGLFAEIPIQAANAAALARMLSARGGWAAFAGEDENSVIAAMELVRVVRANGAVWSSSRELERLTLPGVVQTGADAFAAVTRAQVPGFPRLWQFNAYYWIATQFDPRGGTQIVLTHTGQQTASNNQANRNEMRKNRNGITARLDLFRQLAGAAVHPVDAFIAIHSNANGARSSGSSTLYLDIRAAANDPVAGAHDAQGRWVPNAAYVEDNLIGQRFAQLIHDEVNAGVPVEDHGIWSYIANGNQVAELRETATHLRTPGAAGAAPPVNGIRAHAPAGVAGLNQLNFPRVRGRDIPIGYVEMAFHTHADDVQRLAQRWFRHAVGNALAKAAETMIGEHTEDITRNDLKDLLTGVFGPTAEVTTLAGGVAAPSAAQIGADLQTVTGNAAAPADAHLGAVVAAIESARDAATRHDFVNRLSRALATKAGYDVNDNAQDNAVARAALGPLLRAAGAAEPAANAVPALADLPRPGRPPIRAEVAALLGAGLGLRPADLATVTRPIGAVTLLAALAPDEIPEACVTSSALDAVITQVAQLRRADIYRPVAVRFTDVRRIPLPDPVHLVRGAEVRVEVETAGTGWPIVAADVELVLSVAGVEVATLPCELLTLSTMVSKVWMVQLATTVTGEQECRVAVRARHPSEGRVTLGPVQATIRVGAP